MRLPGRAKGSIDDYLLAHYQRVWPDCKVSSVHWTPEHIATGLPDLHIAKVVPAEPGQAWIFATIGAWRGAESDEHGLELVARAGSEAPAAMKRLGQLAYYNGSS